MAQTDDNEEPSKRGSAALGQATTHAIVAAVAAGLAIWVFGSRAKDAAQAPAATERASDVDDSLKDADAGPTGQRNAADEADGLSARGGAADGAARAENAPDGGEANVNDDPVRIVADPPQLRVWHNTRITLRAQPRDDETFVRYVWHFEDGSDPEQGEVVAHIFPESVADRHVTLEAWRNDKDKVVVSRKLPIERLAVVPVDGDRPVAARIPRPRGTRLLMLGDPDRATLAAAFKLMKRAGPIAAIVVSGNAETAANARRQAVEEQVDTPMLHLDAPTGDVPGEAAVAPTIPSPLRVIHDPERAVRSLIAGAASIPVIGNAALVAHDSRSLAIDERQMVRTIKAMQAASAYPALVMLTTLPLAPLVDADVVAPSAYRLYEHALRNKARAVVSASSGVAFDGRYGGVEAVGIGAATGKGCRRLLGHDDCQSRTVTLLDVPKRGRVRARHLRLPQLVTWLGDTELPAEVGKYRR